MVAMTGAMNDRHQNRMFLTDESDSGHRRADPVWAGTLDVVAVILP